MRGRKGGLFGFYLRMLTDLADSDRDSGERRDLFFISLGRIAIAVSISEGIANNLKGYVNLCYCQGHCMIFLN